MHCFSQTCDLLLKSWCLTSINQGISSRVNIWFCCVSVCGLFDCRYLCIIQQSKVFQKIAQPLRIQRCETCGWCAELIHSSVVQPCRVFMDALNWQKFNRMEFSSALFFSATALFAFHWHLQSKIICKIFQSKGQKKIRKKNNLRGRQRFPKYLQRNSSKNLL